VSKDQFGRAYLIIHTGSRNLGRSVAHYYQKQAIAQCHDLYGYDEASDALIESLKSDGREKDIQSALQALKGSYTYQPVALSDELCYLTGKLRDDYLHDMRICQKFAMLNRALISNTIYDQCVSVLCNHPVCDTGHNYIDDDNIVRKGAVSARDGELFILPLNMRDGSLLCRGKGNEDWNFSAPHGAGRAMSRSKARETLNLNDFKDEMSGVYTTTICASTLDEAPEAYKAEEAIRANLWQTASIENRLAPIYNFKAV